jgi:SAM-dependent methyltransferase
MAATQRLSVSIETLAALGAELRLRQDRSAGDRRVRALLNDVARTVDPQLLAGIDDDQASAALALIQTIFRQAMDLLDDPARDPGWTVDDPAILQSQRWVSRFIVRGIDAMATQRADLAAMLRQPGVFLDIGTGVGWLAIGAARAWPALRIVGVDPWEPALALARQNLENSGTAERVELRRQRVEELDEAATFTLAWFPGPFIAAQAADRALARVHRALAPGGWLIFGLSAPPPGPLEEAVNRLRIVRSGGHPWRADEVEQRLRALDFRDIEMFSPPLPVRFVVGRRAA